MAKPEDKDYPASDCVIVADRHQVLVEGMRALLETVFGTVVMVADEGSLFKTAARLKPCLAIVDLSLPSGSSFQWLPRLHACCPGINIIVTSNHDEPSVRRAALCAGAEGFVLKRTIARDLLPTVNALVTARRSRAEAPPAFSSSA